MKSALVRTVPAGPEGRQVAVDTWWVDAGSAELPAPATLETALRRLADGDRSVLDRLARRDAGYRLPAGAPSRPRVVLVPGASADVTVLEVRAADRPGLLHAIGSALAARRGGPAVRPRRHSRRPGRGRALRRRTRRPAARAGAGRSRRRRSGGRRDPAGGRSGGAPAERAAVRLSLVMEAQADLVQPAPERSLPHRRGGPATLARPALVYLTGQVVVLAVVWVSANAASKRLWEVLQSWDARQLLAVSQLGYPDSIEPGGPELVRVLPRVPAGGPLDAALTGLSPEAAGCPRVGRVRDRPRLRRRRLRGRSCSAPDEAGRVRAVLMVATLPLSAVFLMPYTEAMFCALALWALVCGARDRWLAAGVLASCAGLVRPTAAAVVLAVWVGAALAWRRGRVGGRRALAAVAVAPLGVLAYLGYVALVTTGSLTAWSESESKGWDTRFDYGRFTWSWLRALFQFGGGPMDGFIVAGAVVAVLTAGWLLRERLAVHAAVYVLVVTATALGTSGMWGSKFRFLLPGLVVSAVLAAALMTRWRASSRVAALLLWVLTGAWFSGYALVAYHFAI